MRQSFNILISPLDWGLGHATRCIPIISILTTQGCNVFIAAEGNVKKILEIEFPNAKFLPLNNYNIKYSKQKRWLPLKMLLQSPHILFTIYKEHQWLKKIIKTHSINAVISDNRFGMYTNQVPCVYITHQLLIKTGNNFIESIISRVHRFFINKYTQCWVPDFKGNNSIAGELSHPLHIPSNVKYIGCLSRFQLIKNIDIKYDLLIVLSGPEPQRTILEKMLLVQLKEFTGRVLLVRGLPSTGTSPANQAISTSNLADKINIVNHLNSDDLNLAIQQAEIVLSRSGYTTIMDLIKLRKKAILIPTPGQTEQEYLAKHLMENKLFYSITQNKFLLKEAIEKAGEFNFSVVNYEMTQYKKVVVDFTKYKDVV